MPALWKATKLKDGQPTNKTIADTSFPNIRKRIGDSAKKAKAELHFEVSRLNTKGAGIPQFLSVLERTFKDMDVDNKQVIIGEADGSTRVAGSKRKAAPKEEGTTKKQKSAAEQPSELPEKSAPAAEPTAAAPKKSPFAPSANVKPKKSASK